MVLPPIQDDFSTMHTRTAAMVSVESVHHGWPANGLAFRCGLPDDASSIRVGQPYTHDLSRSKSTAPVCKPDQRVSRQAASQEDVRGDL